VEACGGSGDGASLLGEDGLVAFAVGVGVVALDVGRERHVADLIEDGEEIGDWGEAEGAFAEFAAGGTSAVSTIEPEGSGNSSGRLRGLCGRGGRGRSSSLLPSGR
jgi:hypothetical protein